MAKPNKIWDMVERVKSESEKYGRDHNNVMLMFFLSEWKESQPEILASLNKILSYNATNVICFPHPLQSSTWTLSISFNHSLQTSKAQNVQIKFPVWPKYNKDWEEEGGEGDEKGKRCCCCCCFGGFARGSGNVHVFVDNRPMQYIFRPFRRPIIRQEQSINHVIKHQACGFQSEKINGLEIQPSQLVSLLPCYVPYLRIHILWFVSSARPQHLCTYLHFTL